MKNFVFGVFRIGVGLCVTAIGYHAFLNPFHLSVGGITGLCVLLYEYFGLPYTLTLATLNIALFIWGIRVKGLPYVAHSFFAMMALGVLLDMQVPILKGLTPVSQTVAMLWGAFLTGVGYGLVISADVSTGGSDLLAMLVIKHCHEVTVGMVMNALDLTVVLISGIFSGVESFLLSIAAVLVCNSTIDITVFTFSDAPMPNWLQCFSKRLDKHILRKRTLALFCFFLLVVVSHHFLINDLWNVPLCI